MPDYYETLGVSRNATIDEIKQSYRKLARKYHPDVASNKAEAEHKFKEINEAYSVLSDPEKKQQYDLFGTVESRPGPGMGGFGFEDFFGGDIFDAFFGFGRQGRRRAATRAQRGSDIRYDLEITLEEAYEGIEKDVP
ncbi:MAG: DnaJ domain-containing protein, partial [Firmicutes bacterium]|nr:DnaJ domain-containing protein [Bacillota bacterium]